MHRQPHHTDFGLFKTERKREKACLRVFIECSLRARRMLHAVSLNKAFIWYLTQQDFEAALFNRCTAWSDLTEVPRLEITSFWSKFHQSKWLPQSRLLFHVCDLEKPLICIKCPKYIHKTSIQWPPELLFWTPPGSQGELESLSQLWSPQLWDKQASCSRWHTLVRWVHVSKKCENFVQTSVAKSEGFQLRHDT